MDSKRSINRPRVRLWRAAKKIVECQDSRKYAGLCENFVSLQRSFYKKLGYYDKWLVAHKGRKLTEFREDIVVRILEFILKTHKEYGLYNLYVDEVIRSPGKFESEPTYTLYYYSLGMESDGEPAYLESEDDEEDSDPILIGEDFDVTDEERFLFPALEDTERIRITYSESGFVGNEVLARCQR